MSPQNGHTARPRAGSLKEVLENIEADPGHHVAGSLTVPQTPPTRSSSPNNFLYEPSQGFFKDLITFKWMLRPSAGAPLVGIPILLWFNWMLVAPNIDNPFARIIFITNKIPDDPKGRYAKSYWDIAFVVYYIVVFSFIRQSLTIYFLKPLARRLGIHREAKVERFAEQGYAVIYNVVMGSVALYTMRYHLPTWYFQTEHFFIDYPHWEMPAIHKWHYLAELAYWCQQSLMIGLRIEKPRSDYKELVAHHLVTVWLTAWSYLVSMTRMGNAVLITMDWSDVFLSLSKCFNYIGLEKTKTVSFAWFTIVWTYLRHYLNVLILWSIWNEYKLIPEYTRFWLPEKGVWLAPWMRYQMFIPLFILQLLNLFWYFLIWRILLRAIFSSSLEDERSDDEDEAHEPEKKKKE